MAGKSSPNLADSTGTVTTAIQQAKQLELPEVCAPAVPLLYIEMDGTGIPVVKAETEGRAGKVDGQPAHTREVKLGCVFTQTMTDTEGHPVRDDNSTFYVGAIESAVSGRRPRPANAGAPTVWIDWTRARSKPW